jgi:hypothetical protein
MPTLIAQGLDLGTSLKLDENGTNSVGAVYPNIASFLHFLVPLAFVISGVVLLFILLGGGLTIISSGGNAKNVESGRNQLTGAIIGFLVIFAAYWIIQIIEKLTGVPILNSTL